MQIPDHIEGFTWDQGNREKNWTKHRVAWQECEELFFNFPLYIAPDLNHSGRENRHSALGQTDKGRVLFLAFTIRGSKIRVISARDMNRKEKKAYHEKAKADSKV